VTTVAKYVVHETEQCLAGMTWEDVKRQTVVTSARQADTANLSCMHIHLDGTQIWQNINAHACH